MSEMQFTKEETKNFLKTALPSKVVNLFTRALVPPFIGRRRDFYIPKIPSKLRNIPHVHECLLYPVICGADFIHLQACH
jgi:hypothetical protein